MLIKVKSNTYCEKHKEQLNKKVACKCGSIISNQNLNKHLTSQKHKEWVRLYKKYF